MTTQEPATQQKLIRPAPRRQRERGGTRRAVANPLKVVVGPRNLGQALDQGVPFRRREIAQPSGYDAQAQKLMVEPDLRALLVRQIVGGSLPDRQSGMAQDILSEAHGARLEISVPALSKANAQRLAQAFWDVLAEVMAAVDALAQTVRIGRGTPLGAATPKELREIGQLLERTQIFDATTRTLPPRLAQWARTSQKREQAGITVQLRLRAGYGGIDRVMVTGAKGNDNPYFCALLDLESAAPGQRSRFDSGQCKLATYDAIRQHGRDLVTIFHASLTVEGGAERPVPTPETAQGYTIPSDRLVRLGTGKTRAPHLWRVLDATDTQGQRRTILTSLLAESAQRITQVRAYRWTIEIVCRWLKRVWQLDTLLSVSPAGIAMQVAVALIVQGVLLLYPAGGALSLRALQRRVKTELQRAIFAAGVAEGRRQEQARAAVSGASPPRLRAVG